MTYRVAMPSPSGGNREGLFMPAPRQGGGYAADARPSWDRRRGARDRGRDAALFETGARGGRGRARDRDDAIEARRRDLEDRLSQLIPGKDDLDDALQMVDNYCSALLEREHEGEDQGSSNERDVEPLTKSPGAMDHHGWGVDSGAAFRGSGRVSGERSMLARLFPRSKNPVNGWAGRSRRCACL